jgi:hypothetical protein
LPNDETDFTDASERMADGPKSESPKSRVQTSKKNPISDYNTALKRLQMRRRMTPVTLTGVLQVPVQPPPSPNIPPILPVTEADQDDKEDLITEQVSVSEVEQILGDLANGVMDETLPRLSEEDVAFDMDEVVVEEEVIEDDDSDTDDEKDIGWISEGE